MFIAHLPAGYMMARLLARRARLRGRAGVRFLWAGAIGAIAPDFDLAYFISSMAGNITTIRT